MVDTKTTEHKMIVLLIQKCTEQKLLNSERNEKGPGENTVQNFVVNFF
jgi:hypothetical protein